MPGDEVKITGEEVECICADEGSGNEGPSDERVVSLPSEFSNGGTPQAYRSASPQSEFDPNNGVLT
jgi:hypothetical protein